MVYTIPPGVVAAKRRNAIFVPTDDFSVATLTGPTAVEIMCYLTRGTFGVSAETERGTDDRECDDQSYEVLGSTKWSVQDLEYVWEPQSDGSSDTNKAYDTLKEGTPGFLVVRFGIVFDTALAVDDKVWRWPITLGAQVPKTPESGNSAEKLKIVQPVVVTGPVVQDEPLVA